MRSGSGSRGRSRNTRKSGSRREEAESSTSSLCSNCNSSRCRQQKQEGEHAIRSRLLGSTHLEPCASKSTNVQLTSAAIRKTRGPKKSRKHDFQFGLYFGSTILRTNIRKFLFHGVLIIKNGYNANSKPKKKSNELQQQKLLLLVLVLRLLLSTTTFTTTTTTTSCNSLSLLVGLGAWRVVGRGPK